MKNHFYYDKASIKSWLDGHGIKNYMIHLSRDDNFEYVVDVWGNVDLMKQGLEVIPVKFSEVRGYFNCAHNRLKSLDFCPEKVAGAFHCSHNKLKSLRGAPKIVGESFNCEFNQLVDFRGCPKSIGENIYAKGNKLVSLKGCAKELSGGMDFSHNCLVSLKYLPQIFKKNNKKQTNYPTSFQNNPELKELQNILTTDQILESHEKILEQDRLYNISNKLDKLLPEKSICSNIKIKI